MHSHPLLFLLLKILIGYGEVLKIINTGIATLLISLKDISIINFLVSLRKENTYPYMLNANSKV